MAYKRYFYRNGKKFGPYYYGSYRDETGKVRKKYVGTVCEEKIKLQKNTIIPTVLFVIAILLILSSYFVFQKGAAGKIVFLQEENLIINLKEGELLPINTRLVIEQNNSVKEILLSELIDGNAEGAFYVENKELSGEGKGYGIEGEKTSYPVINFKFKIFGAAEESEDAPEGNEEIAEEATEEPEIANESEEAIEEELGGEEETTSESIITGEVVLEEEIEGRVSKENPFSYDVESENYDVEITEVDKGGINDLKISKENGSLTITTDYSETEKGFGKEYLTNETTSLEIGFDELGVEREGLTASLFYQDVLLDKISNEILGYENVTSPATEENITETNITTNETLGITTRQYKAIINLPVKWIKFIDLNASEFRENLTIELPKEAENISVKTGQEVQDALQEVEEYEQIINEADREELVAGGITGDVSLEIKKGRGVLIRVWNWVIKITITGKVIQEQELAEKITEKEESKEIDLQEIAAQTPEGQDIAVEYYTEAPQAFEEEISQSEKQITISAPSELNYTDILAYTELVEESFAERVRLYHLAETGREEVNITKYDLNGNNLTDYVEWIVPHLSNQTYELIIEISKAEHLDENKSFISDIYNDVKEKDNNWSEIVNNDEYVRVTFEQNLTREKDITIYARSSNTSNASEIEVYTQDNGTLITKFENITQENWYKVYLSNLGECYDNETEILTLNGNGEEEWKYFYELSKDEKVMTLNSETGEKEWQIPYEKQVYDNDKEMYKILLEDGSELLVSEKHKVYVWEEKENQISLFKNILSKSAVVNTGTSDCSLKCGSLDQIKALIDNANARYGESLGSGRFIMAFVNMSSYLDSLKNLIDSSTSICLISNSCSESLDLNRHSSSYFINSNLINSGAKNSTLINENKYVATDSGFIIENKTLLSNTSFILVYLYSSLFSGDIDFNNSSLLLGESSESSLLNESFFALLPSSTDHLINSCSSGELNLLNSFCLLNSSCFTNSDQTTQTNLDNLAFNSSSSANVMLAIYSFPSAFNFSTFSSSSTFLITTLRATSATFTSGNSFLNSANNSSGICTVIFSDFAMSEMVCLCSVPFPSTQKTQLLNKRVFLVLTPCSIYFNRSNYTDVYKSFGSKDLSDFTLQPVTETYEEINNGKELYFLDAENNPVRVKSIEKQDYDGKIYDVDVENDIVLVRRNKRIDNLEENLIKSQNINNKNPNNLNDKLENEHGGNGGEEGRVIRERTAVWSGNSDSHDTFDLKVIGNSGVEFDYIVDPIIAENIVSTDANLVNITAETNFTHLNISTTAPYNNLNLIGYWNFDGDKENTQLTKHYDFSDYNIDGTGVGNVTVNNTNCIYGDCANFDGQNASGYRDYISLTGVSIYGNANLTFSVWIKPDNNQVTSTYSRIISSGDCYLNFGTDNDDVEVFFQSFGSNNNISSGSSTIIPNNWNHVVGMYNGTEISIWVNGVQKGQTTPAGTYGVCGITLIGVASTSPPVVTGQYNGSIDEIMIFNSSLTAAQILAIYNNQSSRFAVSGTQDIVNQSYMNISTGNNRVNVTTYIENNLGSSINLSVGYYDASWSYTAPQVVSSGAIQTFSISSTSTNLTLNYTFYAGNSTAPFYSPIIKENITFEAWNEVTGDTTPPNINFTSLTPGNGSTQAGTSIFVNVTANDSSTGNSNISTFIDFDNSLVAWWRMDDVNASGDVVDYTGRYNLTKRGDAAQTDNGFLGKGFNFTNTGNLTRSNASSAVMTPGLNTISFGGWVKWGSFTDPASYIIAQDTVAVSAGYEMYAVSGSNKVFCWDGDAVSTLLSYSISTDTWYNIFCVFNSTDKMLYVNGILRDNVTEATAVADNAPFSIGNLEGSYQLNGSIDDIMIFNRTLSASEIKGLYANKSSEYLTNNFTINAGTHTFKAYSQDTSGNVNSTETRSVSTTGVNACGTLDVANTAYTQTANIIQTANADCIVISAQNITFNGNGYWINQSTGYDAIYSNQYNTTIKNANITGSGSSYGINLNSANNSYIVNNTIKIYGSGISLYSVFNTLIENNTQSGSSNVGISLSGSNNNIIRGNSVTNNYDYDSSGINFLTISNNNTIIKNTLQSNGNQEIQIRGDNNTITNNNIWNCSVYTSVQVCIEVSGNNNVFDSNKINKSAGGGITITGNNTLFKNTNMTNINVTAVSITSGTNNTFLNASYVNESVAVSGQLIRKWYYRAYVNDTGGKLVSGANVTAFNITGSYNFNLTTDATGYTSTTEIIDYINNGGVTTSYNNYNITARNSSYFLNSHTYNVTLQQSNYKDVFMLSINESITRCAVLDMANTVYTQQANIVQTANADCIVISAQNITFDGNGYWIANSTNYNDGIYSNQLNTTIKNCNITMGTNGVNFEYMNNSQILNTTLYITGVKLLDVHRNTFTDITLLNGGAVNGFGLVGCKNNTFTNIFVESYNNGFYVQSSSINNNFTNLTLNSNALRGMYFEYSGSNNTITDVKANSNAIAISIFESENNTFTNMNIWNCTDTGNGCLTLRSGARNTFSGGIINLSSFNLIHISSSGVNPHNNLFKNLELIGATENDIHIDSWTILNITLLNVSYTSEYVYPGSQLIRKWYYRAYVNDTSNNLMGGVNITVYNRTSSRQFNLTTDSTGYTQLGEITDYVNNGTAIAYYSLHNIYAGNSSWPYLNHTFNVTALQNNNYKDVFTFSESRIPLSAGWNMIGLTLHDTDASTDRNISVVQNWNLFGYSSATPINVTHLNFTNSTAVVNWTKAVSQGKVLAYFYYRDNNVYRYSATPDLSMQDYALRQNRSYWTKIIEVCNSSQPCNISMPGVGGSLAGQSYEWNKLRFSNGSLELNITEADNATYNWIFMSGDSVFHYWDGGDRTVCGTASCDDDTLYPWDKGYWIWVNQNNIQILRRN